jgi:hypothetical protein
MSITEKQTQEWINEEYQKCKESPYYFATTYLEVSTPIGMMKYTTILSEEEFNKKFKEINGSNN